MRSAVTSSEARLDIKAGGFWARGVTAFFDVRVTHVNSKCYQSKPTSEVFKEQEEEKKRKYQQRVLDVEMGSFTPLVFGTNGGMGNECQRFVKHLADKIAQKDTEPGVYHGDAMLRQITDSIKIKREGSINNKTEWNSITLPHAAIVK